MGLDLITKAEYKQYEGITNPNSDGEIDSIIPKASQLVKNYCRRTFVDFIDEAKTEFYSGGERFYLTEFPVIQIQSVGYSTDYGQTYTDMTEYTDWVLDKNSDSILPIPATFPTKEFPEAINGYKVVYTAGYETIPEDLKLAAMDLVTYYMKNDGAVHSPKAPGSNSVQIEYISTTNLPAHIKRVLDLYVADYT